MLTSVGPQISDKLHRKYKAFIEPNLAPAPDSDTAC